jgi:hypothetical protein
MCPRSAARRYSRIRSRALRSRYNGLWLTLAPGKGWSRTPTHSINHFRSSLSSSRTPTLTIPFAKAPHTSFAFDPSHMQIPSIRLQILSIKTNSNHQPCPWAYWGMASNPLALEKVSIVKKKVKKAFRLCGMTPFMCHLGLVSGPKSSVWRRETIDLCFLRWRRIMSPECLRCMSLTELFGYLDAYFLLSLLYFKN